MSDMTYIVGAMNKPEKEITWLKGEVKTPPFTLNARLKTGRLLRHLQDGEKLSEPDSKPIKSIGKGCHELRIRDKGADWRIVYHIHSDVIVVLDVFNKKTNKTPKTVINGCKIRLNRFYDIY